MEDAWNESTIRVVVGSLNPCKINSARMAFTAAFPSSQITVRGIAAPSLIPDQPYGDDETLLGARNRAKGAAAAAAAASWEGVTHSVGMEGGVGASTAAAAKAESETPSASLECFAWMVVLEVALPGEEPTFGREGVARTGSFVLPDKVSVLVRSGVELGFADDIVFDRSGSKTANGAVGLLTHDVIGRTEYYIHAMTLALIPFHHPELYTPPSPSASSTTKSVERHVAGEVVMIRPAAFGPNPETAESNVFMTSEISSSHHSSSQVADLARDEFDAAVQTITSQSGVIVHVVQDSEQPHTPDAVFPNNWFSTHTPSPSSSAEDSAVSVVLYRMESALRRDEVRRDIFPAPDVEANLLDLSSDDCEVLEGTGSLVLDRASSTVFACLSARTSKAAVEAWAESLGYSNVVTFSASDREFQQPIYHTNVLMAVGDTFAVICLAAIDSHKDTRAVMDALMAAGKEIIPITHQQMESFAGNMIQLRDATRDPDSGRFLTNLILSQTAYKSLDPYTLSRLSALNDRVIPVSIPTIEMYGGGSARCMIAEWHLSTPPPPAL